MLNKNIETKKRKMTLRGLVKLIYFSLFCAVLLCFIIVFVGRDMGAMYGGKLSQGFGVLMFGGAWVFFAASQDKEKLFSPTRIGAIITLIGAPILNPSILTFVTCYILLAATVVFYVVEQKLPKPNKE